MMSSAAVVPATAFLAAVAIAAVVSGLVRRGGSWHCPYLGHLMPMSELRTAERASALSESKYLQPSGTAIWLDAHAAASTARAVGTAQSNARIRLVHSIPAANVASARHAALLIVPSRHQNSTERVTSPLSGVLGASRSTRAVQCLRYSGRRIVDAVGARMCRSRL